MSNSIISNLEQKNVLESISDTYEYAFPNSKKSAYTSLINYPCSC